MFAYRNCLRATTETSSCKCKPDTLIRMIFESKCEIAASASGTLRYYRWMITFARFISVFIHSSHINLVIVLVFFFFYLPWKCFGLCLRFVSLSVGYTNAKAEFKRNPSRSIANECCSDNSVCGCHILGGRVAVQCVNMNLFIHLFEA